jgi:DNA repair exonuclease SbcCD ATPase subunit
VILFYEDFMLDWTQQLALLAQFVNGSPDFSSEEVRAQATAFVDKELHHHSTPIAENLSHPEISFEAKALYLVLREHASGAQEQRAGAPLPEGLLEGFAQQAMGATQRSKQREGQMEELRANRQQLEAQCEHLKVVHQNLELHRQKVERQLVTEQGSVQELSVVREQLEKKLAASLGELSESRRACQVLEGALDELRQRAEELSADRDNATAIGNELRRQLNEVESSIAWKAVGKVRATMDLLIPPGTGRRKLYDLGRGVLKNGRLPRTRE